MKRHHLATPEAEDLPGMRITTEPEPRRVCRRLQLMSRMEHHEQNDEQIIPRFARTSCSHGFGQSRAA